MAQKRLTLLLYGADRELWGGGKCTLTITRVEPGNAKQLKRQTLPPKTTTVNISLDAQFDHDQAYLIVVTTPKHRDAWHAVTHEMFIRIEAGTRIERDEAILRLILVPKKTSPVDTVSSYSQMLEAASPFVTKPGLPREDYEVLTVPSTLALLNMEAKLRSTRIGGIPLLSHVQGVRRIEPDRVYLFMDSDAKRLVQDSADFASAPGHGVKPGLPAHPDSWKHKKFPTGNVQLSFSKEPQSVNNTLAYSVDVDIDLERGLAHLVEWLDNNVFDVNQTDQTIVYALLYGQGITPYYALKQLEV